MYVSGDARGTELDAFRKIVRWAKTVGKIQLPSVEVLVGMHNKFKFRLRSYAEDRDVTVWTGDLGNLVILNCWTQIHFFTQKFNPM